VPFIFAVGLEDHFGKININGWFVMFKTMNKHQDDSRTGWATANTVIVSA